MESTVSDQPDGPNCGCFEARRGMSGAEAPLILPQCLYEIFRPSLSEAGGYPRPDTGEHTEHGYAPAALQTSWWRCEGLMKGRFFRLIRAPSSG